jgi:adenine-specific DNA-methyltransferase
MYFNYISEMLETNFEKAFVDVQGLVKKFEDGINHYMSPSYSESAARQDFIDDFFIALGWDVTHRFQHDPYKQEVKIEKTQKQHNESAHKRADYAFHLAPNYKEVKFFVEAKKPSVHLKNAPAHYFQTIKYGWNAGCAVSVLTDFEEFVIVDCRAKPNIKYALNGKHESFRYTDYADKEKFAKIYYLFSRESVEEKSIENYAENLPKAQGRVSQRQLFKGGYQAIDESFLEYIDSIRETIAKAFKKSNADLDSEALTEATQKTIDRLVFIRFLEDKLIEPINHITEWSASANAWKSFISDCKTLNAKYNGVVFKTHFIDKENFLGADEKLFADICSELSSINSPYDFNYIPIHILGSIYERFLGKIVVATAKQVHIEEKPEVRKAGGVYYTPKYIVDYIVANTVGKLIENKTPEKIAEMHFADIACGSGSFLIGVYDYLLQYHKDYYQRYPTKAKVDGCVIVDGVNTLSIKQKQDILLNNIYGVDIDSQAVEVTQLSLFLKMLEDETLTSTMAQAKQTSMYTKVLPDLTKNIVCGNSLIGTHILTGRLFGADEERRLNPMDYDTTFPKIIKEGGFDVILGNPPYVEFKGLDKGIKDCLEKVYTSTKGKYDLFIPFIEKGIQLLKQGGYISFILPSMFTKRDYGKSIRKYITENTFVRNLVYFGDFQVFNGVTVFPFIFTFTKEKVLKSFKTEITYFPTQKGLDHTIVHESLINPIADLYSQKYKIQTTRLTGDTWQISNESLSQLKLKLQNDKDSILLKDITEYIFQGIASGKDEVFYINENIITEQNLEREIIHPILKGKDVNEYSIKWSGVFCIYPYDNLTNKALDENKLKLQYPNIYSYLNNNRSNLKGRPYFDNSSKFWYELWCERNLNKFRQLKIVNAEIAPNNRFQLDSEGFLGNTKIFSTVLIKEWENEYLYVLGLLNSNIMNFYHKQISVPKAGGFFEYKTQFINLYPIKKVTEKSKFNHDIIIEFVQQMLDAKSKLESAKLEKDIDYYEKKCMSLNSKINTLVYQLYGLSDDEIKIIEEE